MTLASGTRFGAYEIAGALGAGGMGEVYRATDTKLGREVAIKTLPAALATDPDRLARFEREAKLLAALNHAHIASVYGLDEHEGTLYLAMELVAGETLEAKLKRGALPVEEALQLALQIAEALEAAHEKQVVHRDLKPANVMVTPQGVVKVLDFGLAKAFSGDPNEAAPAHSPALSLAMTQQGLILGTAGYMAPEQASGQATDQRADIWAFGVLFYEMLTGLPLFSGESVPHVLADVLRTEPDWNKLPKHLHPRIRLLLERCLAKKPRNRLHSIADARIDIEAVLNNPQGVLSSGDERAAAEPRSMVTRLAVAVVLSAAAAAFAGWSLKPAPEPTPMPVNRFEYSVPASQALRNLDSPAVALSPDGRQIVYDTEDGLYVRSMSELTPRLIEGTEAYLTDPLFSPDGETIAFWDTASRQLRRVAVSGGAPAVIAEGIERFFGASWAADGTILFAEPEGIFRVLASGGEEPELIVPTADGQQAYGPQLLPGGDVVLFSVAPQGHWDEGEIVAQSISTGDRRSLLSGGSNVRYLPTGHLVYALGDRLFVVPFDLDTLTVTGAAVPVVEGVMRATRVWQTGVAQFDVSVSGTLTYISAAPTAHKALVWVNRDGTEMPIPIEPRDYSHPRISPDGARVVINEGNAADDLWVWDTQNQTLTRLILGPNGGDSPIWTPDGTRIAYHPAFGPVIDWRLANNVGSPERFADGGKDALDPFHPDDFSPSGDEVVFLGRATSASNWDIGMAATDGSSEPVWLLKGKFNESAADISPDGRWLAYQSNESGRVEVYVRPFPNVDDNRWLVSNRGGSAPSWSGDGRELFYLEPGMPQRLMAVKVSATGGDFSFADRAPLLDWPYVDEIIARNYDVSADGQRFLAVQALGDESQQPRITIVENWFEELNGH